MSANNILTLTRLFSDAPGSAPARCQCLCADPEYRISARIPVVRPKWTVETLSDGSKRLVQRWSSSHRLTRS